MLRCQQIEKSDFGLRAIANDHQAGFGLTPEEEIFVDLLANIITDYTIKQLNEGNKLQEV